MTAGIIVTALVDFRTENVTFFQTSTHAPSSLHRGAFDFLAHATRGELGPRLVAGHEAP